MAKASVRKATMLMPRGLLVLPKAFRFEGEEVSIRRKRVILEPLSRQRWPKGYWKSWGRYSKHLEEVEPLPSGERMIDLDER